MFSRQVSLPEVFSVCSKNKSPRPNHWHTLQVNRVCWSRPLCANVASEQWWPCGVACPWLANSRKRLDFFQGDKLFGYWLEPSDVIAKRKFTSKFGLISICLRLVPDNLVFSRMLWYLLRVLYVTRVCVHLMKWIDHHNCRSFAFYIVWEVVLPAMLYLLTALGNGSCWRSRLSPNTN